MKKKIILLIGLVFMLCGCSADVNIELTGSNVKENVYIYAYPNEHYTKERLNKAFRKYIPAFAKDTIIDTMPDEETKGISYYKRSEVDLGNGYRFNYKYNFNLSNYKNARTVKEGFKSSNIYVDNKEKTILFSTDNGGLLFFSQYPDLNTVNVNIKTDYKVKETNADSVDGNVYTWKLSRNNNNKNIYLLLDSSPVEEDKDDEKNNVIENNNDVKEESKFIKFVNEHPFLVIFVSFFLFLIIVLIISKITKNK